MVVWFKSRLIQFFTLIGVFSMLSIGHAQNTFAKRFYLDHVTVASNVIEIPDGYIVSGIAGVVSTGLFYNRQFFVLLDADGNQLDNSVVGNYGQQFLNFNNVNTRISSTEMIVGTTCSIDGIKHGTLFWIDEDGNTIDQRDYLSPSYDAEIPVTNWMVLTDICINTEGYIYFSAQIGGEETGNDFCILKLNTNGDIIWTYINATSASYDLCYSIGSSPVGGVVLAVIEYGANTETVVKIIELDGNGEEISIQEMPLSTTINDFVITDESIVVATYRKEPSFLHTTGHSYKASLNGELEWERNFGGDINPEQRMHHVVNSQDGAYVFGGNHFEDYQQEPEINGTYNWYGWLVKVDDEGDILWERNYHYVTSQLDEHKMYDLKATSDGGYIFCGEATDHDYTNPEVELPIQQAWVVKVDGCGCLVPGCDPNCVVSVPEMTIDYENTHFLVGPNPATQFLNIHVLSPHRTSRQIVLHNLQGKELTSFPAPEGNTTYMLNIEDYPAGVYLLSLIENGKTVQTERVVKE
jgi:hypothetical protein